MKLADPCGCFPTGRHYPGIAHLLKVRAVGVATELDAGAILADCLIAMIDTETTGRDSARDRLVEVGVVLGRGGVVLERKSWLVNPGCPIPAEASAIHHIQDADVADAPPFSEITGELFELLKGAIPAAYNASFDRGFLLAELDRAGIRPESPPPAFRREVDWLDPLIFARELQRSEQSRSLGDVAARLGISLEKAHRATDDAEAALEVLYAFLKDARLPKAYGAVVQEQRRLGRQQEEARRSWRR